MPASAAAGISFEVVPGVSSAIAAAALAGIPVTHRGLSSGFVVVSGHAEDAYRPVLESLAPHSATVVVMMGLGRIDGIAELLIERGWNVMTPAAVIFGASTASSDVWTTSLRDLQQQRPRPARAAKSPRESERGWGPASIEKRRPDADDRAPATVVIGDVVRLGAVLGFRLDQGDGERGRELGAQAEADEAAAGGQ